MPASWILVADQARARVLAGVPLGCPFEIARFNRLAAQQALNADTAAAQFDAVEHRADSTNTTSATSGEGADELFAKNLADFLERSRSRHELERLTIVAPQKFLEVLHRHLCAELSRLVILEISKLWTRLTPGEIADELQTMHWRAAH